MIATLLCADATRQKVVMRNVRTAFRLLAAITLTACSAVNATDVSDASAFIGAWTIRLSGGSASSYAAEGSLTLRSSGKGEINGTVDILESQLLGSRRIAGPISGRTTNNAAMDVVAAIGTIQREFIGTLSKDSLNGSWLDLDLNGRVVQAGTFRAARQR